MYILYYIHNLLYHNHNFTRRPFVLGAMFAATGNYDASFYLGGGLFLIGTLFHWALFLPCLKVNFDLIVF